MPIADLEHRILYHDPRFFSAFPAIAPTEDGGLLVFRRARDHRWIRSRGRRITPRHPDFDAVDHVDSRSELVRVRVSADLTPQHDPVALPTDPEAADQDGNVVRLADGRYMQYSFMWYPVLPEYEEDIQAWHPANYVPDPNGIRGVIYLFWGSYVRFSDDGGQTWTPRQMLPAPRGIKDMVRHKRPSYGGAVRGRAAELPDGTLLIATYFSDVQRHGAVMGFAHRSCDGGQSWQYAGRVAADTSAHYSYHEPALLTLTDGQVLALFRTGNREDHLVTCLSRDAGKTWSKPRQHTVQGHPYDPQVLPDGRVALVYGYRHKPSGIRMRVVDPMARDFGVFPEQIIRDDGLTRDLGYPWSCLMPDGRLATVYYFTDRAGVRHIAGSLMAVV